MIDFRGRKAFDLYLKCLQLILRHQVRFLIQDRGLPAELEQVVFDLWALRIAQLGDRIASNDQEADLQSQPQTFSSLGNEESDLTDNETTNIKRLRGRNRKLASAPNLNDCLALCYLGIMTLRLPTTPGDLYDFATDGHLIFVRAVKYVPLTMRDRLPPEYHSVLDPSTLLSHKRFYANVMDLQISFEKDHGIQWPALNVPILLFRFLKELALPIELYDFTLRLGDLLGHDFALHAENTKRLGIRHLPEAQLSGCLIVCTKLLYPFDDERRYPKAGSEPTSIRLNWQEWCRQMEAAETRRRGDSNHFTTKELMELREEDVFSMLSNQLDQYLDFYADTFLDAAEIKRTEETDDFRSALYGMFPIEGQKQNAPIQISDRLPSQEALSLVSNVHSSMQPVVHASDGQMEINPLRPGQLYFSWKKEEDLPAPAKMFFEKISRLVGLPIEMLLQAVSATEARIEQWRRTEVRRQRAGESQSGE